MAVPATGAAGGGGLGSSQTGISQNRCPSGPTRIFFLQSASAETGSLYRRIDAHASSAAEPESITALIVAASR